MTRTIRRFSPNKTALTMAIVFALSSLVFLIPMGIIMSTVTSNIEGMPAGAGGMPMMAGGMMMVLMPIFYFVFGYIFGLIFCWIYNLVAKLTGGIEMDMDDENMGSVSRAA